jgi:hypothetical protein
MLRLGAVIRLARSGKAAILLKSNYQLSLIQWMHFLRECITWSECALHARLTFN